MGGQEKGLMQLGKGTLVENAQKRLSPQVNQIVLNANGDLTRFSLKTIPIISDPIDGFVGPLAGILAGMIWAQKNTDSTHVLSVAADTPFFPENLASKSCSHLEGKPENAIAIASNMGRLQPVFGLWPLCLIDPLRDFLEKAETRKVMAFVDQFPFVDVPFADVEKHSPFFNINTQDELEQAKAMMDNAQ